MKVLHIDRQRGWGGQLNRTLNVVTGLRDRGIDVMLLSHTGSPMIQAAQARGIEPIVMPMYGSAIYATAVRQRLKAGWKKWDIVHTHGARDQWVGLLLKLTGGCRKLLRTRHTDLPLRSGWFSRVQYQPVDGIVGVSQFICDLSVEFGLPRSKIHIIHDGVDVTVFTGDNRSDELRSRWTANRQANGQCLIIGHAARLGGIKGTDLVLQTMAKLVHEHDRRDMHLVVVGQPTDPFEQQACELGIDNQVSFLGFRDDVPMLMPSFDIYFLPTRQEAMGTAFAEAAASGVPVVGSNTGGVSEVVTPETGILVPVEDVDAMVNALLELADDPQRRAAMSAAARERACEHFTTEQMVSKTIALYEQLLGAPATQ